LLYRFGVIARGVVCGGGVIVLVQIVVIEISWRIDDGRILIVFVAQSPKRELQWK
jgi:hypothetical protein